MDQVQVATISIVDACPPDTDGDGVPDSIDNCTTVFNPDQSDIDSDGIGDTCDLDQDDDGIPNDVDNCTAVSNPGQEDFNANGIGDHCDDTDGDTIADVLIPLAPFPPIQAWIDYQEAFGTASTADPAKLLQLRILRTVTSLVSAGIYAIIVVTLYKNMVRGFDMIVRRQQV